jgi:hypothetical protein
MRTKAMMAQLFLLFLVSSTILTTIHYYQFPFCAFSASLDSPCADQLQKCGALVEEFERQLQDLKNVAFRSCFTNTAFFPSIPQNPINLIN